MTTPPHTRRRPRPHRAALTAVTLTALAAVVSPSPPLVEAGPLDDRCEITQVTDTTQDSVWDFGNVLNRESLSGDGTRLVFASNRNIAGHNPRQTHIYTYLFDATTGTIRRVAPTPAGNPVISADGSRVAFTTWDGIDSSEIYAYDPGTEETAQLSDDDHSKNVLSISADGTRIVYLADVVGAGIPHALHVLDTTTSAVIEVLAGGAVGFATSNVVISPDGGTVAFTSRGNHTGANPGNSGQVFVFDIATETLDQVTSTVAGPDGGRSTWNPAFTDGGATLTFSSDAAVLGPNPQREFQEYRYDLATGATQMVPELPVGPPGFRVWSPDGTRVADVSTADPTGANPQGNYELFTYVFGDGNLTQLTATGSRTHAGGTPYASSSDGSMIAFRATANLLGDNPDHNREIYLATTCDPPPQPDGSIATSATGPAVGDDVYSSAPRADQRATQTIARGATRRFFVHLQNDRDATDTLTLRGTHAGSAGYHVSYLHGRTDITAQVQAGTYTTGPLEPGDTATIKIKITATHTAGTGHRVDLAARSDTNPAARDTVRAKVTRT